MGVILEAGYRVPDGDHPLTHARILHSRNWVVGTPSASDTAFAHYEDAPNDSLTYEKWSPLTLPGTWTLTPSGAETINSCCIGVHDLGTKNATLTVEYESAPAVWTTIIDSAVVVDDSPIMCIFAPVTGTAFRIVVDGASAPSMATVRFGTLMEMPQPVYAGHEPLLLARQTVMRSNKSGSGETLGRTVQRTALSTSIGWTHLRADWVREYWAEFQLALEPHPFFLAWRPETFPLETGYCDVEGAATPAPANMGLIDYMQVSMDITARAWR